MGGKRFRLVRWFTGDTVREALDITGRLLGAGASRRKSRAPRWAAGAALVYWEDLAR